VDDTDDGLEPGDDTDDGGPVITEESSLQGGRNAEAWSDVQLPAFLEREDGRGQGIIVAVIDSGCHLDHPALAGRVKAYKDFTPERAARTPDYTGHGTHCCGVVAAADNGAMGGVAERATLVVAKTLGKKRLGKPGASNAMVARAIEWCVDQGASVISMSWGYFTSNDRGGTVGRALAKAARSGVVLCAATGNQSRRNEIKFPAKHRDVIGVGNWDQSSDRLWRSSNKGDGVFVVVPGRRIFSTDISGSGYRSRTGTSMATAFMSGCVALLLGKFKTEDPGRSNRTLHKMVHQWIVDHSQDQGSAGRDSSFGHGLLQMLP